MGVRRNGEPKRLPVVRGDCLPGGINEARPCPYNLCRWYLYPSESTEATCVLDVADQGGATLEQISKFLGVTRERVRQIEEKALRKINRDAIIREHKVN